MFFYLAAFCFWKGFSKMEALGYLVSWKMLMAPAHQFFFCANAAIFQYNIGMYCLTQYSILHPYNCGLKNIRVFKNDLLYFTGCNAMRAALNHIAFSAQNIYVSFLVHSCHISCIKPSITQYLCRLLRLPPVSCHYILAFCNNLTCFTGFDLLIFFI